MTNVYASGDTTCVLFNTARVRCFGDNTYGQLGQDHTNTIGTGLTLMSTVPYVALGLGISAVAMGNKHVCASVDMEFYNIGGIYCWGYGGDGALGYSSPSNVGDSPARSVTSVGFVSFSITDAIIQISAGKAHTCAMFMSKSTSTAVKCCIMR